MRIPNESQLSTEQKEVCYAPTDETIFVVGPPGSGKTVVAVFRRDALKEQNERAETLVHNHVLSSYTDVDKTFMGWLQAWWRKCSGRAFPKIDGGNSYDYDYDEAIRLARGTYREAIAKKGHWGHLIVDEAQDFDAKAHILLASVQERCFVHGEGPRLTIFADENQRITHSNSTVKDIIGAHLLSKDQIYKLKRNYRNTQEVAELAATYYTGLRSGIPDLPTRRGDKPKLIQTNDLNDAVNRIVNHIKLNANEDVGVLVYFKNTRKSIFNKLSHRLKGIGVVVQGYESGQRDSREQAKRLRFDEGGTVTVLCYASAKGLEFDTVFLPELQTLRPGDYGSENTKMQLYVMISRARERLIMMISDPSRVSDVWGLLQPQIDDGKLSVE